MRTIVGEWRLVAEIAEDATGQSRPPLHGPKPLGFVSFTANGRMIVAISNGLPDPLDAPRSYISYCGAYHFDGAQLTTLVDGASDPRLMEAPQVRSARFEGDRLILRPIGGVREIKGVMRELVWERMG
jgi:hypothetical protein